jgi:putative hydrolase of the HAD superfamily
MTRRRGRAVLFDLDETLHDRRAGIDVYARRLFAEHRTSVALDEAAFVGLFHDLDANGRRPRDELFAGLVAHALRSLDVATLHAHFYTHAWSAPVLFANTVETLEALRARGVRIGIVTNGGVAAQTAKLGNSPLASLVDGWVISAELGVRKPDRRIFEHILERLDADPLQSWFVGDDPHADIWGANQAGLKTAWIPRYTPWPDDLPLCHDARLSDVSEVLALL